MWSSNLTLQVSKTAEYIFLITPPFPCSLTKGALETPRRATTSALTGCLGPPHPNRMCLRRFPSCCSQPWTATSAASPTGRRAVAKPTPWRVVRWRTCAGSSPGPCSRSSRPPRNCRSRDGRYRWRHWFSSVWVVAVPTAGHFYYSEQGIWTCWFDICCIDVFLLFRSDDTVYFPFAI